MLEVVMRDEARLRGMAHYFDAQPCKHGHIAKRRTSSGACMECARIKASSNYHSNRDAIAAQRRAKYATDAEIAQASKDRTARHRAVIGRDALREKDAAYYEANCERIKARARNWSAHNRERKRQTNTAWNKANPGAARQHQRIYEKRRRERDPIYALGERIGSAIRQSLIKNGYTKKNRVSEILGCSFAEFSAHIERQFLRGMSWENRSDWHIDHIIPISTAKTEDEVIALHHFTNLRPLWAVDNAEKGDKRVLLL